MQIHILRKKKYLQNWHWQHPGGNECPEQSVPKWKTIKIRTYRFLFWKKKLMPIQSWNSPLVALGPLLVVANMWDLSLSLHISHARRWMSTESDADIQEDELSTDTLQLLLLITDLPALAYQLSCLKQIKNICPMSLTVRLTISWGVCHRKWGIFNLVSSE